MKAHSTYAPKLFIATLIAAGISAFVVLPAHALTRQEVAEATRNAAATGQMAAVGERYQGGGVVSAPISHLTRGEIQREVLTARADGTLTPAGEGNEIVAYRAAEGSQLTRAEVKAEVIAASQAGALSGQGEEPFVEAGASHRAAPAASVAQRGVFSGLVAKLHRAPANAASGS